MKGKLDSLDIRAGFTIRKGSTIYLNFEQGKGAGSVLAREVTDISFDGSNINVEVIPSCGGLFSTYDAEQLYACGFKSFKEAAAY